MARSRVEGDSTMLLERFNEVFHSTDALSISIDSNRSTLQAEQNVPNQDACHDIKRMARLCEAKQRVVAKIVAKIDNCPKNGAMFRASTRSNTGESKVCALSVQSSRNVKILEWRG